jgi:O-antigen/teichoic acid export membrane protein
MKGGLGLVLSLFFISVGFSWQGAALGFLAAAGASVALLGRDLRSMKFNKDPRLSSEMVRYGLPLSATFIASMVLDLSARFIIGIKLGESSVAGYAVGYDLTQQVFGAAMNAVFLAAFPQILKSYQTESATAVRAELKRVFEYLAIGSPLLLGVFMGLSQQIAVVTFGPAVRETAGQVIPLIAIGVFLGGLKSYYLDTVFQLRKRTEMQLLTTAIMAVINVVATLSLLDTFGVVGAAASTVLAFGVGAIVSFCLGRRENLYVFSYKDLLKLIAVTIAVFVSARQGAGLAQSAGIQELLFGGCLAFVAYGVTAYCVDLGGCRAKIALVLGVRG